jgi:hypothetical protein
MPRYERDDNQELSGTAIGKQFDLSRVVGRPRVHFQIVDAEALSVASVDCLGDSTRESKMNRR